MVVDSADVAAVETDTRAGAEHGLVGRIGRCEGKGDGERGGRMEGA